MDNVKFLVLLVVILLISIVTMGRPHPVIRPIVSNSPGIYIPPESNPIPDLPPAEQPPIIITPPVEPQPVAPRFPTPGVTSPGAKTYQIVNGEIRQSGLMKMLYFECEVKKQVVVNGKTFFLVQITEENYQPDYHILDPHGVFIIDKSF